MQTNEIAQMVQQVQSWPIPMRIALARQILESVESEPDRNPAGAVRRGPSAAEIAARFRTNKAVPDDNAVKQWIEEHRTMKYGS